MPSLRLAGRPSLNQIEAQAEQLLANRKSERPEATLSEARQTLAESYEARDWPRLVHACELAEAIWTEDLAALQALLTNHPALLHEPVLIRANSNWGPPLSFAANLGRARAVDLLLPLGPQGFAHALDRAALQGYIPVARRIYEHMGKPDLPANALENPAYTLNVPGTEFLLEAGARPRPADAAMVLETDSRKPAAKHRLLELYVKHGLALPDTPAMALHRGRLDLLRQHLDRDPRLLTRAFMHEDIYPPEIGCHDEILATHGTPLKGATLLHMCMDYDEPDIALWLLEQGAPVDVQAAIDSEGFGGHTPLFATVVSQPNFWMNHESRTPEAPLTSLLLDRGANPNARASLRKRLHPGYGEETLHEYRDVTPLGWGRRFHRQIFVNTAALDAIAARGGHD